MRSFGSTRTMLFPIGFGAMPLSIQLRSNEKLGLHLIQTAIENGINFIDTANVYCTNQNDLGHNERLLAKALRQSTSSRDIYIATKGGMGRPDGAWTLEGNPAQIQTACEESLKNLKTDSIFLYQFHRPDPKTPFEHSIEQLSRLKEAGKIQHIGLSNITLDQLKVALQMVRIETVQNRCNIFYRRDIKNGMVAFCEKNKINYIAYHPLGGAIGHPFLAQNSTLKALASKYEASPYSIALSWLVQQSPTLLPIPGATKAASIQDNVRAPLLDLEAKDLERINQIRGNE